MILIIKDHMTNKEYTYKLNSIPDFDKLFDSFPATKSLCYRSKTIPEAVDKVKRYIDSTSRMYATVHSGSTIKKTEPAPPESPAESMSIISEKDLASNIKAWAEKRGKTKNLPRDTTYTLDPGRLRDEELDEKAPSTLFQKIKAAIKGK